MKINQKLLNSYPKVTVIETFDRKAKLVRQLEGKVLRVEFKNIEECKRYIEGNKFEVNVSHIHGDFRGEGLNEKTFQK